MYTIIVSKELKEACPVFAGAAIYAEVKNTSYCEGLWRRFNLLQKCSLQQPGWKILRNNL